MTLDEPSEIYEQEEEFKEFINDNQDLAFIDGKFKFKSKTDVRKNS